MIRKYNLPACICEIDDGIDVGKGDGSCTVSKLLASKEGDGPFPQLLVSAKLRSLT